MSKTKISQSLPDVTKDVIFDQIGVPIIMKE